MPHAPPRRRVVAAVFLLALAGLLLLLPGRTLVAGLLAAGKQLPMLGWVAAGLFRVARLLLIVLLPLAAVWMLTRGPGADGGAAKDTKG